MVLGGGAFSYERGTPVSLYVTSVSSGQYPLGGQQPLALPHMVKGQRTGEVQGYLAHKEANPPRTLQ